MAFEQRVSADRFQNPFILKTAIMVVSKKNGDLLPIYKTHFEMNNTLYKVEVSTRKKPTKDGRAAMWVKITKLVRRPNNSGFGNSGGGAGSQFRSNQF